jgi:aquaporin Z
MSTSKLARLFAELLGAFALTAVVIAVSKNYGNPLFTSLAAAATLATLVIVLGPVSGGHFNPAITIGLFSVRKIKLVEAVMYVALQAVGAILAWKFFEYLSPERKVEAMTNEFTWETFWAEFVGTAIFAMGVAAAVMRKYVGGHAAAAVGMSLFAGSLAVAVVIFDRQLITGVLNPAVALGIGHRLNEQVYWAAYFAGPVLGAVVGMNLYKMFFSSDKPELAVASSTFKPVAPVASVASTAKKPAAKKAVAKKKTTKKTTRTRA